MDTTPPGPGSRAPDGATNVPEFSVGEISGAVRKTLETAFGRIRVRGEITECKRYPSGHIYLSLKDENAKLESVVWKTSVPRLSVQPENGVEVIATGRITTYADRSKYQLVIDRLEYAGEGALLARIEKLKAKLAAEGLFERKRDLPRLPIVVGVVTSEAGAVIQDIKTTIARRFPRRIILWPVPVQGLGAAERIAAAIAGFGALKPGGPIPRPDVLIVARGGGSLEDLMAFNEEVVVRAAAACPIPLISAVGHETDTTLIDFASDRRAPTPTAAAELAVPARAELLAGLEQTAARLRGAAVREVNARHTALLRLEKRLPDIPARVMDYRRRLDEAGENLPDALRAFVRAKREALAPLSVPHPRTAIAAKRHAVELLDGRRSAAFARRLQRAQGARALAAFSASPVLALMREKRTRLDGLSRQLEALSYNAILSRGFALVRDAAGEPLTRAADVAPGAKLTIAFADGQVAATADGESAKRKAKPAMAQGSLL
ncbi:exodeoxyribonuclease VII large subunit [Falsiroseomonas sp. HW251]|uniref:exodeoxyribonuclease VII large subunit n=1 Tax=Falsiroseomonas sp. HW251 TaxID=3390998 RepID=UPI003D31D216